MATTLDNILQSLTADGDDTKDKLLGAAFVVVGQDGPIYQGAAGRIALPVGSPPFTVNSFTWVASMTKILTSKAVMQIVERGLVGLDDDVRGLVPELASMQVLRGFDDKGEPLLEQNEQQITLRHLLTHTVGLGYDVVDPDLLRWSQAVGRTKTCNTVSLDGYNTPLKFPPGQGWYYGSALDWAGQVLEKVTGQTLGDYMKERFFEPLNLADTTFHPTAVRDKMASRTVAFSVRDADTGVLSECECPVNTEPEIDGGGSGLWMTAADHARVLQGLVKAGSDSNSDASSLLRKETVEEMFRPQLDETQQAMLKQMTDIYRSSMVAAFPVGTEVNHGLGGVVNMNDIEGKRRKGSMTWVGMCNSHWWIDLETGIAASLVVTVLPMGDPVVHRLYDELERAVYRELVPFWLEKRGS